MSQADSTNTTGTSCADALLLDLESRIFERKEALDELGLLADPLDDICCKENHRLHDAFEASRTWPSFDERKAIVEAMPEFKECMRLRGEREFA
jgi:hypothetical protein